MTNQLARNYQNNHQLVWVISEEQEGQIVWFQPLNCEYLLFFWLLCDIKLNVFDLWKKQGIFLKFNVQFYINRQDVATIGKTKVL